MESPRSITTDRSRFPPETSGRGSLTESICGPVKAPVGELARLAHTDKVNPLPEASSHESPVSEIGTKLHDGRRASVDRTFTEVSQTVAGCLHAAISRIGT